MNARSRPTRRSGVLAQRGGDKLLLLNPKTGHYYALDEVGSAVWDASDGTAEVREIAASLGRKYAADAGVIEADAIALLEEMANENLVDDAAGA